MKAKFRPSPTSAAPLERVSASLLPRIESAHPTILVPSQWQWHYEQLQLLREHLLDEHSQQIDLVTAPFERRSDLADEAADEFDHDLALALLAEEQHAVYEIDGAMSRIVDGTYGICEVSGEPIPAERLRAVPWARYTTGTQQRLEQQRLASRRPRAAWTNGLASGSGPAAERTEPLRRLQTAGTAHGRVLVRARRPKAGSLAVAAAPERVCKI